MFTSFTLDIIRFQGASLDYILHLYFYIETFFDPASARHALSQFVYSWDHNIVIRLHKVSPCVNSLLLKSAQFSRWTKTGHSDQVVWRLACAIILKRAGPWPERDTYWITLFYRIKLVNDTYIKHYKLDWIRIHANHVSRESVNYRNPAGRPRLSTPRPVQ